MYANAVNRDLGIYFVSMGVTIHFEGQLKNEAAYQELLEEVSSIAKAEGWSSEAIESRVTTLSRVRDEQDCTVMRIAGDLAAFLDIRMAAARPRHPNRKFGNPDSLKS